MALSFIGLLLAGWLIGANAILAWRYRHELAALWREPVLRHPVLIIESDDWGPAPDVHAQGLKRLAAILAKHADAEGKHPVMTLGMVLAVPDGPAMRGDSAGRYHRRLLAEAAFAPIRNAIGEGQAAGVFAVQLHGMEHYWPPAVASAATHDPAVRRWWLADEPPATEDLPPALQSRWIDGAQLPSQPLPVEEARAAARAEAAAFTETFGVAATVVVPPTFVWSLSVEEGWVEAGVRIVVTPGRRHEARDAQGRLLARGNAIYNGEISATGALYIVRDIYFEPAFGHGVEHGLEAFRRKSLAGRPALLETHRLNFTGPEQVAERAFSALNDLLGAVLRQYPALRFMSTEVLAERIRRADPELVERRWRPRVCAWLQRLPDISGLWRLGRLSGGRQITHGLLRLLQPHAARSGPNGRITTG